MRGCNVEGFFCILNLIVFRRRAGVDWIAIRKMGAWRLKAGDSCDYKASGRAHKGIVCASGFLGEQIKTRL